jgi:hypothetical protein
MLAPKSPSTLVPENATSAINSRAVATALLAAFGSGYMIAAYILFCAIVSIVATAFLPDYTNRDIT